MPAQRNKNRGDRESSKERLPFENGSAGMGGSRAVADEPGQIPARLTAAGRFVVDFQYDVLKPARPNENDKHTDDAGQRNRAYSQNSQYQEDDEYLCSDAHNRFSTAGGRQSVSEDDAGAQSAARHLR